MSPERRARDAADANKHDAAIASTLQRADEAARGGDFDDALRWLSLIGAIGDELPESYEAKRRGWRAAVAAETNSPEPLPEVEHPLASQLEGALARLVDASREILAADLAALGVLDPQRQRLEHFITAGLDDRTREAIGGHPRGRGVLGLLVLDPKPVRLDDVAGDARSYGFPAGHPVMHSFLGVPILIGGMPWGNFYVTEKHGGAFDERDEETAIGLAARAGAMVESARSKPS